MDAAAFVRASASCKAYSSLAIFKCSSSNARRAERLTQAILAKAFRGELVATEAELARRAGRGYEPAAALLARIRAERAQEGAIPRASRGRASHSAGRRTGCQLRLPS